MKILLLMFLLPISIAIKAQDLNIVEIKSVLAKQQTAWNKGEITAFMDGYWRSDSLMFIGKSGITYGYNNTLNNYKKSYSGKEQMGALEFTLLHFIPLCDNKYQVIGKWYLKRNIGDIGGHFTLVFSKIDDKWVIVSDHSS